MKNLSKFLGIIAFAVVIGFSFATCSDDSSGGITQKIGDTGPGGGIIFYVNPDGFTMTDTGEECHYLEAAPSDMTESLAWASLGSGYPDGTAGGIGAGRKNTALILATDAEAPAAKACKNLTVGEKDDWFLPSKDELHELCKNRDSVGIPSTGWYWSSSCNGILGNPYYEAFNNAIVANNIGMGEKGKVRAVRAF
jgi:hypothetical protein